MAMSRTTISAVRATGLVIATLIGAIFFFVIIGVFGLPEAIVGLFVFVFVALLIFRRPQTKGARQ
jgi:hypothetical protein